MKRKFVGGKPPLFGTRRKPKPVGFVERSPWYWWYEYLRRNKSYLRTCESAGRGRCAALYKAFGDVRDGNFRVWWTAGGRGAELFGEPILMKKVAVIASSKEAVFDSDVLVVQFPLTLSKKYLTRRFGQLLKKHHRGKPGAPRLGASSARYPLYARCNAAALAMALQVWDLKQKQPSLRWWEVGQRLRVIVSRDALVLASDSPAAAKDKKNALANVALRYFRRAEAAIENVGQGRFPDYS